MRWTICKFKMVPLITAAVDCVGEITMCFCSTTNNDCFNLYFKLEVCNLLSCNARFPLPLYYVHGPSFLQNL